MSVIAAFMVPHPPLIVPQVGQGNEAQIRKTTKAYEQVADEIAALKPDTIVITTPHSVLYSDYFHISPGKSARGSFAQFRAPQVSFHESYDTEFADALASLARRTGFPAGTDYERDKELDHGTMVPLYFIRQKYTGYKLVRIGLSGYPLAAHYRLGQMIQETADATGKRVVLVASGDLSHKLQSYGPYGFAEEGPQYDARIMDVCSRAAFGELFDFSEHFCDKAAECGHRSFVIMAGAFDGLSVKASALSHEDVTGVGYGICTFYPGEKDDGRHFLDQFMESRKEEILKQEAASDDYVRLARAAICAYVREGTVITPPSGLPSEMESTKAGAFVSIHMFGRLRGCIGTILPTTPSLSQEIIQNAISASTRDHRFSPIQPWELDYLEINVDVLSSPEPISSPSQLDVRRYGVIVTNGNRRGLLLPDLEGVDTIEKQIAIARQKAGIAPEEPVSLERFEVIRHT